MRYMCLVCGQFFESEVPYITGKFHCPYCEDMYFCDNILPDIPPSIENLKAWQINKLKEMGICA